MAKNLHQIKGIKICVDQLTVNYYSKCAFSTGSPAAKECSGLKRGSCMVWEINMGVCPRLDFENIMLFNCLGYNFNIYGAFECLCNSIANL